MYSFLSTEPISFSIQSSNSCFLTHKQVSQETDRMSWYSHLLKSFPQYIMIYTVKGFSVVNKREIFLCEFPCFLCDLVNVGNMISVSSVLSKPRLDIWKFLVHIILKPSMQDLKHDLTSMGDECSCLMVSTSFGTTLLGNWD